MSSMSPDASGTTARVRVRDATATDAAAAAAAIEDLLVELGGKRPPAAQLEAATRQLIEDEDAGIVLIAEVDGSLAGVCAASWQHAIHVPGPYATIQDLWVHRDWRGLALGRELIATLVERAGARGISRLEVGLPQPSFAAIEATERFYLTNGFEPLGPRMRLLLQ